MTNHRLGSVGLAALSYALVLLATTACVPTFYGDGACDHTNNNEECGYDGGDCCECTCVSTSLNECGGNYGFMCRDPTASCVDNGDVTEKLCIDGVMSDGDCDLVNNTEECGYDGGDCCECTCVSTAEYTCGEAVNGGFACIDPTALCTDDDDYYFVSDDDDFSASFSYYLPCDDYHFGDGECNELNNNADCGYDGGDCCECDCVSTKEFTCGADDGRNSTCIDPNSQCVNGYVDAGNKTTVGVTANSYDFRFGEVGGDVGCMENGCLPALARDGDSTDVESRWSCAGILVPESEGPCIISFTFEEPQDIKDVQVAFWRRTVRSRTLKVTINDEEIGMFDSYAGSVFTALGREADAVSTLSLTAVGIDDDEWIDLKEVRFLVEP